MTELDEQEFMNRANALLKLTDTEDPKAKDVQAIQEIISEHPEIWKHVGDLAFHAQENILKYASNQLLVQASVRRSAEELRRSLTLNTDTQVEKLVVAHCVTAFLLHSAIEQRYAAAHKNGLSPDDSLYWEKRLNAAQHRFLRAMETLTRLRRMGAPLLQVNIGKRQTNIAVQTPADSTQSPHRRVRPNRREHNAATRRERAKP